jgi:hypothetical protein
MIQENQIAKDPEIEKFLNQLKIQRVQDYCNKLDQVECNIDHHFSDGIYSRTMKVPAGTFVIGKVHRFKTLNIMSKGKALIYTGNDQPAKEINAPFTFVSNPMERKMAFFLEDSEWINIHPTNEIDLKKIEEKFIVPEKEYLMSLEKEDQICHG